MPYSAGGPFQRLLVDHLFHGSTRVWWTLSSDFRDPQPWVFQLQASYTGNLNALDWVNVGEPQTNVFMLSDETNRQPAGQRLLTHYRILLTTPSGTYSSAAQNTWGTLGTKDWSLAREILRKERLRLGQQAGRPGYLLRRMRYGQRNPNSTDFLTGAVIDSSLPASWGTAFSVGYHPPVPLLIDFAEQDIVERRGGTDPGQWSSRETAFTARVLSFPDLAAEDVWVDATNDQRWHVQRLRVVANVRGVPLIYEAGLSLIGYSDVIYRIPVTSLSQPGPSGNDLPTTGEGCVLVDHNYGGDGQLAYVTSACCGVEGATVEAFLKSDWDAGRQGPEYVVATSQTTTGGAWTQAMRLNPGEYVLRYHKPGEYGPDTAVIHVTAPAAVISSSSHVSIPSSGNLFDDPF